MHKTLALIATVATLGACMDAMDPAVMQNQTLSASCPGIVHMRTHHDLPMRCGPQAIAPHGP